MPRSRGAALLVILTFVALCTPAFAQSGWQTLGDMPPPARSGTTVTFKNAQGVVAVTAIAPEIVRVRFAPGAAS